MVVMTVAIVLCRAVTDWPVWICVLSVAAAAAALSALFAALEMWGEEPPVDVDPEAGEP